MRDLYQIGPGSAGPSRRPPIQVQQPNQPPPNANPLANNAATAASPWRAQLEEMYQKLQAPRQHQAPPELQGPDFEAIGEKLRSIEQPEMRKGPMNKDEKGSFLTDAGILAAAALGATGPIGMLAAAIGGAVSEHRKRRRQDYEVAGDTYDRSRGEVKDDLALEEGKYGVEKDNATLGAAHREGVRADQRHQEGMLMDLAQNFMQFDSPSFSPMEGGDGMYAFDSNSGTVNPLRDASGRQVPGGGSRQYEIDRRHALAEQLYGEGSQEALREALRTGMGTEERYMKFHSTAANLVNNNMRSMSAGPDETRQMIDALAQQMEADFQRMRSGQNGR